MLSFLDIEIFKHPRGPREKLRDSFLESLFGKSDSIHFLTTDDNISNWKGRSVLGKSDPPSGVGVLGWTPQQYCFSCLATN